MPKRRIVRKAIAKKLESAIKLSASAESRLARVSATLAETEARLLRLLRLARPV